MSSAADLPQPSRDPRIGDAERDRAVQLLQEHHAAGRLTASEFEERMEQALAARTQADLQPLFEDLPGDRPGNSVAAVAEPAPVPQRRRLTSHQIGGISSLLWVVAILGTAFLGAWWLFLIPIFVMPALFQIFGREQKPPPEERKQLD